MASDNPVSQTTPDAVLIERAAAAMMCAELGRTAWETANWHGSDAERDTWRERARVALAAIREASNAR